MDVYQQENKLMYIMQLTKLLENSMQLRFIKLLFWFSKIEIVMLKDNSDSEEDIVQVTLERW